MADYSAEEEQIERLKVWWQENRNYVLAGLVLGVLVVVGWRGWESHTASVAEQGSAYYEQLYMAAEREDFDEMQRLGNLLQDDHRRTPYAVLGSMLVARVAMADGNLDVARDYLQWATDRARSRELKALAQLRLARLNHAAGEHEEALALLDRPRIAAFVSEYAELRGDVLADLGRDDEAREAYVQALESRRDDRGGMRLLEMKLDSVGGPPA